MGTRSSPTRTFVGAAIATVLACNAGCSEKERSPRQDEEDEPQGQERGSASAEAAPLFPDGDASAIPPSVGSIRRFAKRWHANALPGFKDPLTPEAGWSRMAREMCGGSDVHSLMIFSGSNVIGGALGEAIKRPDEIRNQLECGRAAFESMGPAVYEYRVTTDGEAIGGEAGARFFTYVVQRDVALDRLPIPATAASQDKLGDLEGIVCSATSLSRCTSGTATLTGKVRGRQSFLTGSAPQAKAFATALAGASPKHPRADAWASLAELLPSYSAREVGVGAALRPGFVHGLGVSRPDLSKLEKEPLGSFFEKLMRDRVDVYGLADGMSPRGGKMVLVLLPRKGTTADTLASYLNSWRKDLLASLEGYERRPLRR